MQGALQGTESNIQRTVLISLIARQTDGYWEEGLLNGGQSTAAPAHRVSLTDAPVRVRVCACADSDTLCGEFLALLRRKTAINRVLAPAATP